jgi:hypothetical protein
MLVMMMLKSFSGDCFIDVLVMALTDVIGCRAAASFWGY